ncbi:phosphatase PAP2 family protein [Streptomyces canus]|uniref:phosphatase PAP2 family protein n=1 Tax=Streptomyces canus TaxID=58343 RepID=UPI003246FD81
MRQTASAVQEAAEHTKLWWAAPAATATFGGWRGRTAAAAGVAAMTTAQVLSNAIANQLYRRRRPPREFVPPEGLRELPDRSSFPSGYTAAAIAFAGAVAPVRPTAGAACGLSASMVSAERVRNGAPYPFGVAAAGAIDLDNGRPGTDRTPSAVMAKVLTGGDAH